MLLHLGGNDSVFLRDVVMIVDEAAVSAGGENARFLDCARDNGMLFGQERGGIRSYVLVKEKNRPARVIASPISAATLLKRSRLPYTAPDEKGLI